MASGAQGDIEDGLYPDKDITYVSVDENATGTTDLIDPTEDTVVHGVYLANPGSTAVIQLEATDGSSTAVLTPGQTAGDPVEFTGPIGLGSDDKLQINVDTAEGSAQTETAAVSSGSKPS